VVTQINTKTLYEQDFNLWIEETVNLLKNRQLDQIDYENLIEEVEDLGKNQKDDLEIHLENILRNLLRWKYLISERVNDWQVGLLRNRIDIKRIVRDSPSLGQYIDSVLDECYETARLLAATQMGVDIKTFPIDLPFTKEQILDPDYLPED
jgi:hypothetical protein